MAKYKVKILGLASYTVDVEVAESGEDLEERLREMLPECEVKDLEFYGDLDDDFILDVRCG